MATTTTFRNLTLEMLYPQLPPDVRTPPKRPRTYTCAHCEGTVITVSEWDGCKSCGSTAKPTVGAL